MDNSAPNSDPNISPSSRSAVREMEKPTRTRWRIFGLLLAIVTINYVDRGSISVALPLVNRDLGINPAEAGFILSAFFWTYTLMQVPGGWLADRVNPRRMITGTTVGWGVVQAATGLITSGNILLALRLLLGIFEGPIYPAGGKLNAMWMPARDRGRGATLLDGGAPLGAAVGGAIISVLILWLGSWRLSFIIAGVGTILMGALAWWYIRDNPRNHPSINQAEIDYIEREHAREDAEAKGIIPEKRNLWRFLRFGSFWWMCLGWLGFDIVWYGLLTWGPSYLAQARHFDIALIGASTFAIFGAGFVGELVGGFLSDAWKARGGSPNMVMRTMLGFAAAVVTIAVFLVAYVPDAATAVALLAVTVFFLRWAGLYWSVPSTLTDRENAGVLGGAMNFTGNVGGIIIPIVIGLIVNATGSFFLALMVFVAAGVLFFVSSVLLDYSHRLPV